MKQNEEELAFDMKRYFKKPEDAEQFKFTEYVAVLKKALREAMLDAPCFFVADFKFVDEPAAPFLFFGTISKKWKEQFKADYLKRKTFASGTCSKAPDGTVLQIQVSKGKGDNSQSSKILEQKLLRTLHHSVEFLPRVEASEEEEEEDEETDKKQHKNKELQKKQDNVAEMLQILYLKIKNFFVALKKALETKDADKQKTKDADQQKGIDKQKTVKMLIALLHKWDTIADSASAHDFTDEQRKDIPQIKAQLQKVDKTVQFSEKPIPEKPREVETDTNLGTPFVISVQGLDKKIFQVSVRPKESLVSLYNRVSAFCKIPQNMVISLKNSFNQFFSDLDGKPYNTTIENLEIEAEDLLKVKIYSVDGILQSIRKYIDTNKLQILSVKKGSVQVYRENPSAVLKLSASKNLQVEEKELLTGEEAQQMMAATKGSLGMDSAIAKELQKMGIDNYIIENILPQLNKYADLTALRQWVKEWKGRLKDFELLLQNIGNRTKSIPNVQKVLEANIHKYPLHEVVAQLNLYTEAEVENALQATNIQKNNLFFQKYLEKSLNKTSPDTLVWLTRIQADAQAVGHWRKLASYKPDTEYPSDADWREGYLRYTFVYGDFVDISAYWSIKNQTIANIYIQKDGKDGIEINKLTGFTDVQQAVCDAFNAEIGGNFPPTGGTLSL